MSWKMKVPSSSEVFMVLIKHVASEKKLIVGSNGLSRYSMEFFFRTKVLQGALYS